MTPLTHVTTLPRAPPCPISTQPGVSFHSLSVWMFPPFFPPQLPSFTVNYLFSLCKFLRRKELIFIEPSRYPITVVTLFPSNSPGQPSTVCWSASLLQHCGSPRTGTFPYLTLYTCLRTPGTYGVLYNVWRMSLYKRSIFRISHTRTLKFTEVR